MSWLRTGYFAALALITVENLSTHASPQIEGQWSDLYTWPIMAVHCAVLPDGNLLCVTEEEPDATTCPNDDEPPTGIDQEKRVVLFDPAGNTVHCMKEPNLQGVGGVEYYDPNHCQINQDPDVRCKAHLFCSGHTHLADGRLAFFGGQGTGLDKGYSSSHDKTIIYDYTESEEAARWSVADVMPSGVYNSGKRYYPTVTALGDGSHLVVSGGKDCVPWTLEESCGPNEETDADIPIIFTPFHATESQYAELTDATQYFNWYPFNFVLSDGTVLSVGGHYFGAEEPDPQTTPPSSNPVPTFRLNLATQAWTELTTSPIKGGSAVMYRPDKIMKAGGGLATSGSCNAIDDTTTNRAFVLDARQSNPTWSEIDSLSTARVHHVLITLPNGEVMALGGSAVTDPDTGCYGSVLAPEIINPEEATPTWRTLAFADSAWPENLPVEEQGVRYYHSIGLLLPDGRVLSAGGENHVEDDFIAYRNAQIFLPPYLFDSYGELADRPTIVSVTGMGPDKMLYGEVASVETASAAEASNIVKISLLRLGAMTHSFDHDARFMWLDFEVDSQNTDALLVTAPPTGNHAPPGHYMMFIINEEGVPSISRIVQIGADCNDNDVFDFDDLMAGTMTDCNRNRYPDQCESLAVAPIALHQAKKNRHLSINPAITCPDTIAIELKLVSMKRCSADDELSCEVNGDCPTGQTCIEHGDVNNVTRWVGEPFDPTGTSGMFYAHAVESPVYREWTEQVVHIADCEIVPVATYQLRSTTDGTTFSDPVTISTIAKPTSKHYGDVVGGLTSDGWTFPQGVVNVTDVQAVVLARQGASTKPHTTWVDIFGPVEGAAPDGVITCDDIQRTAFGFEGDPYTSAPEQRDPSACPSEASPITAIGDPIAVTISGSDEFLDPEEWLNVHVMVGAVEDLAAYEVALAVSGGSSGNLILTDIIVDEEHADFVFDGLTYFEAKNLTEKRVSVVQNGGGTTVTGTGYLATFVYQAEAGASGVFEIEIVGDGASFLNDCSGNRLAVTLGSEEVVGIGIDCWENWHCNDNNACTTDACTDYECVFTNATQGTGCSDGLFCTATDTCNGSGVCTGTGSPCPPVTHWCNEFENECEEIMGGEN